MQFLRELRDRIRSGEITCSIRLWQRPQVRVGGSYSLPPGQILVTSIREMSLDDVTPALARRSGFMGVVDLLKTARLPEGYEKYVAQEGAETKRSLI